MLMAPPAQNRLLAPSVSLQPIFAQDTKISTYMEFGMPHGVVTASYSFDARKFIHTPLPFISQHTPHFSILFISLNYHQFS